MPIFEFGEFVLFLVIFFGYVPVVFTYVAYRQTQLFFIAYTAILLGSIASNLEAFVIPAAMELVEHGIGIALAGMIFLVYAYRNYKETTFLRSKMEDLTREAKR